jgi:hypothetical protein
MYKNTVIESDGEAKSVIMIDSETPCEAITNDTLRLGRLGIKRLVFQTQADHDEWLESVVALRQLLLSPG